MDEPKDVNAGSTESHCKARAFHDGAVRRPAGGAGVVEALDPLTGIDDTQTRKVHTSSVESRLSRLLGTVVKGQVSEVDVVLDVALGVTVPGGIPIFRTRRT